jgi:LmbE family N-acetylglucosaminyl deacetylase
MMKKILVIAPHPDDEVIGCGGFILNKIKEGNKVFVIFFGYIGGKEREIEANEVKKKAGISSISFFNVKEPFEFNNKNLKLLIKEIRNIDPHIILVPHKEEGDRDHKVCYEICREAIWMSKIPEDKNKGHKNSPTVLLYEVHSPLTEVNYYEDISKVITKK